MTKDIRELVREARGWQAGHSDDSQRMVWLMNKLSDALEARAGEVERWEKNHEALQDKIDCMKSCGCAYDAAGDICGHHSPKLLAAEAERDRLKAALEDIGAIAYDHGSIAAIAHARKALGDAS
mgnify:CR=1 FL=1